MLMFNNKVEGNVKTLLIDHIWSLSTSIRNHQLVNGTCVKCSPMSSLTQGVISTTHILKTKRLHNIIYMPHGCICVDNL
jgi:hypothetical protein